MLEARHYSAAAKPKGSYALPPDYDGAVNEAVLYDAVRAHLNNQRQGNASTKTRGEVSGGNQKPWRQKGTGRARQGTIRAPQWVGGGIVFGPKPRSYRTTLPRKVRRLARQSALNARAREGAITVVEALEFAEPKTRRMVEFLDKLDLADRKVLVLTAEVQQAAYLAARNLRNVQVMRYSDVAAFHVLWAEALVIEEAAIGGHEVTDSEQKIPTARARRAAKATARAKRVKKKTTRVKRAKKAGAKKATKKAAASSKSRKGGGNA